MIIRYISIHLYDSHGFETKFASVFNLENRFISNYLSRNVRLLKLSVGDKFNMISVAPGLLDNYRCRIVGEKALRADVPFGIDYYNSLKGTPRYHYVLSLLEKGYIRCYDSDFLTKEQVHLLHELSKGLEKNGFVNEWIHKTRRFKKLGIEAALNCSLTAVSFQLEMVVRSFKDRVELCRGIVAKTPPHEVNFDPLFKDVIIQDSKLIITEYQDRPKFVFDLQMLLAGKFSFEVTGNGLRYVPM